MTDVQVDVERGSRLRAPSGRALRDWASAALGPRTGSVELAVRLVGAAESRRLNRHYRGKDRPTNVLSFPAAVRGVVQPRPLGDIVICPAVLRREAREQGKRERAHWAHLMVHGVLHLVGYDHEDDSDARRMERREVAVLRRLGFDNPYAVRSVVRGPRRAQG
jgi:probable rRNA maturation factor